MDYTAHSKHLVVTKEHYTEPHAKHLYKKTKKPDYVPL
jgi:hypothetical protein